MGIKKIYGLAAIAMLLLGGIPATAKLSDKNIALCKTGTAEQIKAELGKKGLDLDDTDTYGQTALLIAIRENRPSKIIKELLDAGADPESCNNSNATALMYAAQYNTDPAVIKLLIGRGANIKAKDKNGKTALSYALIEEKSKNKDNPDVVEALIKGGADAKETNGKDTLLTQAISSGASPEVVSVLIRNGADANAVGNYTALYCAVKDNKAEIVKVLLDNGADANQYGNAKRPYPLIAAASNKPNAEIIGLLLEAGADETLRLDPQDKKSQTILEYIKKNYPKTYTVLEKKIDGSALSEADIKNCKTGTAKQIRQAMEKGELSPSQKDKSHTTALMYAAGWNKDPGAVSALLEKTSDVNARNSNGETALTIAAGNSSTPEVIGLLIKAGAKIDYRTSRPDLGKGERDGWTPIRYACANTSTGVAGVIKALLAADKSVKMTDVLFWALQSNTNPDAVAAIIAAGADVTQKDANSKNAYMYALDNANPVPFIAVIKKAEPKKADIINAKDRSGNTALITAITSKKDVAVLSKLIECGADVSATDEKGNDALMVAAFHATDPAVITALIKAKSDVNRQNNNGTTPLIFALCRENAAPGIVKALLDNGAKANKKNKDDQTPLMYAITKGSKEIVEMLIECGADVNAVEKTVNNTPLIIAAKSPHSPEIAELLLKAGANAERKDSYDKTAFYYAKSNTAFTNSEKGKEVIKKLEKESSTFLGLF